MACNEDEKLTPKTLFADAGEDQEAMFGETVLLDGSNTYDELGNPISFLWEVVAKPGGSNPGIYGETSPTASFLPDAVGEYKIRLTATTEYEQKTAVTTVKIDYQRVEFGGNYDNINETWAKTTPDSMPD